MTRKTESRRDERRRLLNLPRSFRPCAGLYFAGVRDPSVETLGYGHQNQSRNIAALDKAVSDGYLAADAAGRTQRSD